MTRWYVLVVCPGRELKIRQKLIENQIEIEDFIVPDVDVDLKKANEKLYKQIMKELRERCKLLAGYFFVKLELNRERWIHIIDTENVYCFLGAYLHNPNKIPRHVPEKEINRVKEFLKFEKVVVPTKVVKFAIDDEVSVVSGDLSGIQGRIIEITNTYVKIIPATFLQSTTIIVPANCVEKN